MNRREPPLSAGWVLQHLATGDCNEALSGDLLEEFCAGRSEAWYWRQVAAACVVSWFRTLQANASLLLFALVWSLMSPAWNEMCSRIEDSQMVVNIWPMFGGFWAFPAFLLWAVLHATFLWSGVLVFTAVHRNSGHTLHLDKIRRGLLLAPLVFSVVYGSTFVILNLYWYSIPHLANQRLATAPLEQIMDLRILADAIRLPYFVALLVSLWGVVDASPRSAKRICVDCDSVHSTVQSQTSAFDSSLDLTAAKPFFALTVAAGLMNSMIVGFLLCRLPESHAPSLTSVLIRATCFVGMVTLAGIAGSWIDWNGPWSPFREQSPMPFRLLALVSASAWVWVAPMVIFSEQISAATALVALIGAYALASGLRHLAPLLFSPAQERPPLSDVDSELFANSLNRPSFDVHGYVIAIGIYAACAALAIRANYTAAAFLALAASVFAWNRTLPTNANFGCKRAATQLAGVLTLAVLVTTWALLDGIAHRDRVEHVNEAPATIVEGRVDGRSERKLVTGNGDGYASVILFPFPEKEQIVPPVPKDKSFLAPGNTRPLIIRFEGAYRYVQPPEKVPGANAHSAQGTPLEVVIESNNSVPLLMDAHQNLAATIPTKRCREIQVDVENHESHPGPISLALLLTDGTSPERRELSLGQQLIESSESDHFSFKPTPVFETLHFSVPETETKVRKFDEITVLFLPDIAHSFVAPKIAIQQFRLIPR
jgi:hypothetical protein